MARLLSFQDHALARLREQIAAAEEANQDLIAFARGHSGTVAAIHAAVLSAIEAEDLDHLIHIVTQEWPQTLGLDAVALAHIGGDGAFRADASGVQAVDARLIGRSIEAFDGVVLRAVARGHPLFGPACELIRAEALIPLTSRSTDATGLLALGQRGGQGFETRQGSELLLFLGAVLMRCIDNWLTD